jgi:D-alanine-D-alanine ligase
MQEDPFAEAGRKPLDIVLAFNATTAVQRGDATDALPDNDEAAIAPVVHALESLGHRVRPLGLTYDNLSELESLDCQFVLNLCEGTGLDGHPGLEVVDALERHGIPYSGASAHFYWLTTGKWRTKTKLAASRVPVPLGAVLPSADVPLPSTMKFPLFVKPRDGFGSLGVHEGSIVHDVESARRAVREIVDAFGGYALVEQFIAGREITVGLIGSWKEALVLPALEVKFGEAYRDKPKIRMFATKFDESSALYYDFETLCPAPLTPDLEARVKSVALAAYRAVGGDGYARVDMRLSEDGTPYVLEVNANCSLEHNEHPSDCGLLPLIGRSMGWSYADLLSRLIGAGLRRSKPCERPALAARWYRGRVLSVSLIDCEAGLPFTPFGRVYPSPSPEPRQGTFSTTTGRRIYVEPDVRNLEPSSTPNLAAVRFGDALVLQAVREIRAGDPLTIDPECPIEIASPVRRPRACGRPVRAVPRVPSMAGIAPSRRRASAPPGAGSD